MIRVPRGVAALLIVCSPLLASADVPTHTIPRPTFRWAPPQAPAPTTAGALAGQVIYLNKCENGCDIRPGTDDASMMVSEIATRTVHWDEFAWQPGEWDALMKCMKDVYSPYNVVVTDQRPASSFNMEIVAGAPQDIGLDGGIGGIALVSGDCSPRQNSIAFAFTSAIDTFAHEDGGNRVWGMCWTAAQEVAHIYGLDHEFSYVDDNSSACNDPMTYQFDCGGEKFFRNRAANCGGFDKQPGCGLPPNFSCSTAQNSHARMLTLFGPGTPTTTPPEVSILTPTAGGTIANGGAVAVNASAQRGIAKLELWINGYKWAEKEGNAFGPQGQTENGYVMLLPQSVPDGVMDITVKAYDDIEVETDSTTVTVTKGAPCADASSCANGQKCDAGKCFWDPATGELGDDCTYPQFCMSGMCEGTSDKQICTQGCVVGSTDACPAGFDCLQTNGNDGICFTKDSGGCCSTGGSTSSNGVYAQAGLALGIVAFAARRRRRRR
jgi:MYXO-CTERM domain-containing protein